jgi:hypothetical protein
MAPTKQQIQEAKRQEAIKAKQRKMLIPKIQAIFRRITKDIKTRYISKGIFPDMSDYEALFKAPLTSRAITVSNIFKRTYRSTKGLTEDIDDDIREELLLMIEDNIRFITDTNTGMVDQLLNETIAKFAEEGIEPTRQAIADDVSRRFLEKSVPRSEIIADNVVNTAAESAKSIEVENLIAAGIIAAPPEKTWVTILDGKERPAHHDAHGQKRPLEQPFLVGGEFLMFPKDRSRGASAGNIINCRCLVIYS